MSNCQSAGLAQTASGAPVCPFHRRRVLSLDHESIRPSVSTWTALIDLVCPSSTASDRPVYPSQIRRVWSSDHESTRPSVHGSVVAAVTPSAHGCDQTGGLQGSSKVAGGVLNTPIGMEKQSS